MLRSWCAPRSVVAAGLCHAAYGTDGFPKALLSLDRRSELQSVIGSDSEHLVYLYASCDRNFTYATIGSSRAVRFRDRFTGEIFEPLASDLCCFAELTFANELDLVEQSRAVAGAVSTDLALLLNQWRDLVSEAAWAKFVELLGARRSAL